MESVGQAKRDVSEEEGSDLEDRNNLGALAALFGGGGGGNGGNKLEAEFAALTEKLGAAEAQLKQAKKAGKKATTVTATATLKQTITAAAAAAQNQTIAAAPLTTTITALPETITQTVMVTMACPAVGSAPGAGVVTVPVPSNLATSTPVAAAPAVAPTCMFF